MDLNAATFIKAMVNITAFPNIHRTTIADRNSLVKSTNHLRKLFRASRCERLALERNAVTTTTDENDPHARRANTTKLSACQGPDFPEAF